MNKYQVVIGKVDIEDFAIMADYFAPNYEDNEYAFINGKEVVARIRMNSVIGVVKIN